MLRTGVLRAAGCVLMLSPPRSQWLLSTECSLSACSPLDKFDPTTSTSYKNGTTAFSIAYGSGDARGHLGADTVTLGGFSVQSQTFGVVNSMSDGLLDSPLSGLMGMGFKSLTVTGTTPWWISLASSTAWSEPLFGFYMKRYRDVADAQSTETEGGTLTLGYVDETLYEGDITYVSVDSDKQRYWNIPIASECRPRTAWLVRTEMLIDRKRFAPSRHDGSRQDGRVDRGTGCYRYRNHLDRWTRSRRPCVLRQHPQQSCDDRVLCRLLGVS